MSGPLIGQIMSRMAAQFRVYRGSHLIKRIFSGHASARRLPAIRLAFVPFSHVPQPPNIVRQKIAVPRAQTITAYHVVHVSNRAVDCLAIVAAAFPVALKLPEP